MSNGMMLIFVLLISYPLQVACFRAIFRFLFNRFGSKDYVIKYKDKNGLIKKDKITSNDPEQLIETLKSLVDAAKSQKERGKDAL